MVEVLHNHTDTIGYPQNVHDAVDAVSTSARCTHIQNIANHEFYNLIEQK